MQGNILIALVLEMYFIFESCENRNHLFIGTHQQKNLKKFRTSLFMREYMTAIQGKCSDFTIQSNFL